MTRNERKVMIRAVLATTSVCAIASGVMLTSLQKDTKDVKVQLEKVEKSIPPKDILAVANDIVNCGYDYKSYLLGYRDQIEELEIDLDDKDSEISKLKRKNKSLKQSYENRAKNSVVVKYKIKSKGMTKKMRDRADDLAYLASENYSKYGILPSIVVGQAMQETTMGTAKNSVTHAYGWWGVISRSGGYASYSSLEEGATSYMSTLNNGLYEGAVFETDRNVALLAIQDGGYCEPAVGYASKVLKCIRTFGFEKYDKYYLDID